MTSSPARARILVVEDRDSLRRLLERALAEEGHEVAAVADLEPALALLASAAPFELVLTDLALPGGSGLDVVSAARARATPVPVVVMTAFGTVAAAVEAMKRGAADFLEKPVDLDQLSALVARFTGADPAPPLFEAPGAPPIVGRSPRLKAALRLLERVAPTATTVLLTGGSGTGKELFARALHALSPAANGPFVALNCAAIPEALVESELFGHERGAFTGADRRRPGRFEQAAGGTLFLDEIGELPLAVQAKLLRVLDGGGFERVGGGARIEATARIVAATNRELGEMVAAGQFRSDLHFRLEVFPIALPALAERADDIPLLVRHLLPVLALRHRVAAPELADEALDALARHPWPGNVRQLQNALERAVILHPGERLNAAGIERLVAAAEAGGAAPVHATRAGNERGRRRPASS